MEVDITHYSFRSLSRSQELQGQSGFARCGWPYNLTQAPSGQAANAQCLIQRGKTGRDVGYGLLSSREQGLALRKSLQTIALLDVLDCHLQLFASDQGFHI